MPRSACARSPVSRGSSSPSRAACSGICRSSRSTSALPLQRGGQGLAGRADRPAALGHRRLDLGQLLRQRLDLPAHRRHAPGDLAHVGADLRPPGPEGPVPDPGRQPVERDDRVGVAGRPLGQPGGLGDDPLGPLGGLPHGGQPPGVERGVERAEALVEAGQAVVHLADGLQVRAGPPARPRRSGGRWPGGGPRRRPGRRPPSRRRGRRPGRGSRPSPPARPPAWRGPRGRGPRPGRRGRRRPGRSRRGSCGRCRSRPGPSARSSPGSGSPPRAARPSGGAGTGAAPPTCSRRSRTWSPAAVVTRRAPSKLRRTSSRPGRPRPSRTNATATASSMRPRKGKTWRFMSVIASPRRRERSAHSPHCRTRPRPGAGPRPPGGRRRERQRLDPGPPRRVPEPRCPATVTAPGEGSPNGSVSISLSLPRRQCLCLAGRAEPGPQQRRHPPRGCAHKSFRLSEARDEPSGPVIAHEFHTPALSPPDSRREDRANRISEQEPRVKRKQVHREEVVRSLTRIVRTRSLPPPER